MDDLSTLHAIESNALIALSEFREHLSILERYAVYQDPAKRTQRTQALRSLLRSNSPSEHPLQAVYNAYALACIERFCRGDLLAVSVGLAHCRTDTYGNPHQELKVRFSNNSDESITLKFLFVTQTFRSGSFVERSHAVPTEQQFMCSIEGDPVVDGTALSDAFTQYTTKPLAILMLALAFGLIRGEADTIAPVTDKEKDEACTAIARLRPLLLTLKPIFEQPGMMT